MLQEPNTLHKYGFCPVMKTVVQKKNRWSHNVGGEIPLRQDKFAEEKKTEKAS